MDTKDKIATWDNLPPREKRAMGAHYITHESNLNAWNKPFEQLSKLKQKRVLSYIESFSMIKDHNIIS
jgi:hypothetical protein